MTIKEVAQLKGLSHQAIYKRLKSHGVKVEDIRDRQTGQLTPDGERIIRRLFDLDPPAEEPIATPDKRDETTVVEGLRNQVAELTTTVEKLNVEVEKLRNQVASGEERISALVEERDFLRKALDQAQQLQAITLAKVPNVKSLPPADEEKGRLRGWWNRVRGRGNNGN